MTEHQRLLLGIAAGAAVVVIVVAVVVVLALRRRRRRRATVEPPLLVPERTALAPLEDGRSPGAGGPRAAESSGGDGLGLAGPAPAAAGSAEVLPPGAERGASGRPSPGRALDRLLRVDLEVDELVEQLSASSPLVVSYTVRVEPGLVLPESWRAELVRLLVELLRCPERIEERSEPLLAPLARRAHVSLDLHGNELELVVGFDGPIGRHWGRPGVEIGEEQAARLAVASWSGGASVHYRLPLMEPGPTWRERPSSLVSKLP